MPTMKLLVAVATPNGTSMMEYITGTLINPPPMPLRPDSAPASAEKLSPTPHRLGV